MDSPTTVHFSTRHFQTLAAQPEDRLEHSRDSLPCHGLTFVPTLATQLELDRRKSPA
jgi:hypothetical protein